MRSSGRDRADENVFKPMISKHTDDLASVIPGSSASAERSLEECVRRLKSMHELLASGSWFTAEQINARQAAPPVDKAQPANHWERCGRIFSVSIDGTDYFAGYQFDSMSQPLPIIKDILDALGPIADSWKIAAWFHFPNGWIAGTGDHEDQPVAPMDALDHRESVINAAKHLHETYIA
ncbi:hypothetical protein [Burkholderia diffusa]|uniref:hypothetical protein n=1 Tax=Burkholderia diffusa TaxID=488732 RepID=UPI00157B2356|nr:hypothetical protein [Burkholderia diffusa]NTY38078.1 hypothetical protein [Burkholderia diffusa]